jgi:hypothetical protein
VVNNESVYKNVELTVSSLVSEYTVIVPPFNDPQAFNCESYEVSPTIYEKNVGGIGVCVGNVTVGVGDERVGVGLLHILQSPTFSACPVML